MDYSKKSEDSVSLEIPDRRPLRVLQHFNPNQTKLFLPLKDQGGEESRRSSFCNTIMLFFTQITHIRSQMKV